MMSLNFNPLLWFVCRLCKETFSNPDVLKTHKIENHFEQCIQIKCIVFEEKLLDYEWKPVEKQEVVLSSDTSCEYILSEGKIVDSIPIQESTNLGASSKRQCQRISTAKFVPEIESECSEPKSRLCKFYDDRFLPDTGSKSKSTEIVNTVLVKEEPIGKTFHNEQLDAIGINTSFVADSGKNVEDLLDEEDSVLGVTIMCFDNEDSMGNDRDNCVEEMQDPFGNLNNLDVGPSSMNQNQVEIPPQYFLSGSVQGFLVQSIHQNYSLSQPQPQSTVYEEDSNSKPDPDPKPFMCQICYASFGTNIYLKSHMKTHSDERPFKCPWCDATRKTKTQLKKHLIRHGRETQYKCRFCNKSCTCQYMLDNHERIHTGERPFKCTVSNCYATFLSKPALTQHVRVKHSEELGLQRFVCPICGHTFPFKCHLKQHMLTAHEIAS